MESNDILIMIKGEDKTSSVMKLQYDKFKPVVYVVFNGGKRYLYKLEDVVVRRNPKVVSVGDQVVLKNGSQIINVESLYYFGDMCRIVYRSGYRDFCRSDQIRVIPSALDDPRSKDCFEYLKQIALCAGLQVEGVNILAAHYNKIEYIRSDSILAAFLNGSCSFAEENIRDSVIYPFGFNLSQKQAVLNALKYDLSIIEGPPGTGKTQTILNIIANAVIRGGSVAVVSSNNSATANVLEKLKKYGVDFIAAPLGNSENKETFIENQSPSLPDFSRWSAPHERDNGIELAEEEICSILAMQNELSSLTAELNAIDKEQEHFIDYYDGLSISDSLIPLRKVRHAQTLLDLAAEYEVLAGGEEKPGSLKKLLFSLKYRLRNTKFFGTDPATVSAFCQHQFYSRRTEEIKSRIAKIRSELDHFDLNGKMRDYTSLAMKHFKASLAARYKGMGARRTYAAEDLRKHSEEFIKDYPVILSTTYSLRSSLSSRTVYDYVIMDEASQVDLATGALALSCAKKAVIVGDLKQLPNVVDGQKKAETDRIFSAFALEESYRYSANSLLSSLTSLFPDAPHVLLKEHYRCHPEIIGFCNQRFYNGDLTVLSRPKGDREAMMVYRTAAGNHARGHVNQRQIDVIVKEVIPQQKLDLNDSSVGIVTPYRAQADELQKVFAGTTVKADTADKFQGQERSVMIFSTVDNEIGDFASDPNRLNVAVSRAIDQFIIVTDGNDNDSTSPIHELIGYISYNHHEIIESGINSVFDYLYEQNSVSRERVLQKYGRASEFDSENLMLGVIKEVLARDEFSKYGAVMHVPLRMLLNDLSKLGTRELTFTSNHLTHVDFLIFSKLTHEPVLVIEVDGFAYHHNEKQMERDAVKNAVLEKYGIPILRLGTTGSGEKEKIEDRLRRTGPA
ncbi:MAG: DUF2726 domain-containing protein [Clostridiales bacterium]|nr:DUF2726 domain-containing protein [Clostridiales bacterium]